MSFRKGLFIIAVIAVFGLFVRKSLVASTTSSDKIAIKNKGVTQKEDFFKHPEPKGSLTIKVVQLRRVEKRPLVSAGIPFALGQLKSARDIIVFGQDGKEIRLATKELARWPQDNSIRSVTNLVDPLGTSAL